MLRFLVTVVSVICFSCPGHATESISVASFNVKWIGYYAERRNAALAALVEDFDIVVIQELVSPPYEAAFPDGSPVRPDEQSARFFDAMQDVGFEYALSPEDTGPGGRNHSNASNTEWFVAFYDPQEVTLADDLPGGYIDDDLTANPDFERVPYAFPFRVPDGPDFVLISVHLQPDRSRAARLRRQHELESIVEWIDGATVAGETDFIILGDMNIQSCRELESALPNGYVALNDECRDTVPASASRPYDQVFYRPNNSSELIDEEFDLKVIDLVEAMKDDWNQSQGDEAYPGDPYRYRVFPKYYSDHNPIHFRILVVDDRD